MKFSIDANVLIDVLALNGKSSGFEWSSARRFDARQRGDITICAMVFAEFTVNFSNPSETIEWLRRSQISPLPDFSFAALHQAAKAQRAYRRAGGERKAILADFFIGADALDRGQTLITRDSRRFKTYFPTLNIFSPNDHS